MKWVWVWMEMVYYDVVECLKLNTLTRGETLATA